MTLQHFVWLGSKRAQKNGITEKGWRLDMAARVNLPVPNGGILLDNFYWLARQEAAIVVADGRVQATKPEHLYDLLYNQIHFPKLATPCAVRPLFGSEAPAPPPSLQVNVTDVVALAEALCRLWTAVAATEEQADHAILIQEMVTPVTEGTGVSRPDPAVDQLQVGQQTIDMPKLTGWQRPSRELPNYGQRAQQLLRGIRRSFGQENWRISWADDGRICWLLQLQTEQ